MTIIWNNHKYLTIEVEELSKSLLLPSTACLRRLHELENKLWEDGDDRYFYSEVNKLDWMELDYDRLRTFKFVRVPDDGHTFFKHWAHHNGRIVVSGCSYSFILDLYKYMLEMGVLNDT
jgi:hypothetical protein